MDPRLEPTNGLIALVRGEAGWPRPLGDAGLRLHLLEAPVHTASGLVVADAVLLRNGPPLVLLAESKSGGNIDVPQAEKYAVADLLRIKRSGSVPASFAETARVASMFVCRAADRDRVSRALADHGIPAALLSIGEGEARLTEGARVDLEDFQVRTPTIVPPYFPFDQGSSVEHAIQYVAPALLAAMTRPGDVVEIRRICADALREWAVLGRGSHQQLENLVVATVRELQRDAYKGNIEVEAGGGHVPRVRIVKTPRDFRPQGRTQGYQRLQRRVGESTGRSRPGAPPGQEVLFDQLADLGGLEESADG